jgi:hypothetical protein
MGGHALHRIVIAAVCCLAVAGCNRDDRNKFDLSCTGTVLDDNRLDNTTTKKPYALQLRISIKEMQWCSGACEDVAKINRIDDRDIYLQDRTVEGVKQTLAVNRYTGELHDMLESPEEASVVDGAKCQKKPFSGFPNRQF